MTIGIAMDDRKRPSKDANQGDVGVFDSQLGSHRDPYFFFQARRPTRSPPSRVELGCPIGSQNLIVGRSIERNWYVSTVEITQATWDTVAVKKAIRQYLKQIGAKGGSVTSLDKAKAARKNGLKGGRPRKR